MKNDELTDRQENKRHKLTNEKNRQTDHVDI